MTVTGTYHRQVGEVL